MAHGGVFHQLKAFCKQVKVNGRGSGAGGGVRGVALGIE